MHKLRSDIILLVQEIKDLDTLKMIYQFIRGIKSSHK